jgi:hypothetical protein
MWWVTSPLTMVLDCHSPATICHCNRGIRSWGSLLYSTHRAGLLSLGEQLTLQEEVESTAKPHSGKAGWPWWLNGRLLLQEAFRAWETFIWLRSQGCLSKDFQMLFSSWQWLVNPIQAPGQMTGIPGHKHQMTNRQEQGSCPGGREKQDQVP